MKLYITTVGRRKGGESKTIGIYFLSEWTEPMGFTVNSLVQFIPEPGGAQFRLCNENIRSYSELYQNTEALGGVLVHTKMFKYNIYPWLGVSGKVMDSTGLALGDKLIARFYHGLVHLRKIPKIPAGQVKVIFNWRISGQWMLEYGFTKEAVLTVDAQPGSITCLLQPNGIERTAELVKYARANSLHLIQVGDANPPSIIPLIEIHPSRFAKAGFAPDEPLLATCDHGRLVLTKIDFKALGFPTA